MKSAEDNNWTETKEFCIDHCEVGEGPHVVKVIKTSGQSTITVYCNGKIELDKWKQFILDKINEIELQIV